MVLLRVNTILQCGGEGHNSMVAAVICIPGLSDNVLWRYLKNLLILVIFKMITHASGL